jgi:hypothetical protein
MAIGVKAGRPMIKGQLAISEGKPSSESQHAVAIDPQPASAGTPSRMAR